MSTIKHEGRVLDIRLHAHQWPDSTRDSYFGGPKGSGYLEGPLADIRYLKEKSPKYLVLLRKSVSDQFLSNIVWYEPELMWDNEEKGYEHGLIQIDWE